MTFDRDLKEMRLPAMWISAEIAGNSMCKVPKELPWCIQGIAGIPLWLAHRVIEYHIGKVAGELVG